MLDWIFEGIVSWVSRVVTQLMDAISGLFLEALGTDMTAMEEYFPFVSQAFTIMQYTAWTILFLVTVWQLFRAFGGPLTEAENPLSLILRSALFALLIWFARPIFMFVLDIARAPYTALMDVTMGNESFTFAGIEAVLRSGLISFVSFSTVVGSILLIILIIALGWNYFKLLLEVVERYVVVGVLCYTSPLAYSMGASKETSQVFKSWCRMVGSQLLLLVMNVWFLRAFNSSVGRFVGMGGGLSNGHGSIFLWLFYALAFLKVAQRFDSYLGSIGLNVAQTGTGLGMELLMASRVLVGLGSGGRSAGSVFRGGGSPVGGAGGGFAAKFSDRFKGNSYVRDAVVKGGTRMGAGGPAGLVGRFFGGIAAKNGASLNGNSIASVANRTPNCSGGIAGDIADRSIGNYMPHLKGKSLHDTQISGGTISTKITGADGQDTSVNLYNAAQYEKPAGAYSIVTASDGSTWYQVASGNGAGAFYDAPGFNGTADEGTLVSSTFPGLESGTVLRTAGDGVIEATSPTSVSTLWYNSAYFDEPDAPHTTISSADGVEWYAMQPHGSMPAFESGDDANEYNRAQFHNFMPGFETPVTSVSNFGNEHFEVRHADGSGTAFYDSAQYSAPRGDYHTYEDVSGHQWYAVSGTAAVERRPVYEDGNPVYEGSSVKTYSVETVRYPTTPTRYESPARKDFTEQSTPRRRPDGGK